MAATCPAAAKVTALIVDDTTEVGTQADAICCYNNPANAPPETARGRRPRLQCCLVGHSVDPVSNHLARHNGPRLADEDEKRRLVGALDVVVVVENPTAYAPNHRAVPPYEDFEGRHILTADEAFQQLSISQFARILKKSGSTKVLNDPVKPSRHQVSSSACGDVHPLLLHYSHDDDLMHDFVSPITTRTDLS